MVLFSSCVNAFMVWRLLALSLAFSFAVMGKSWATDAVVLSFKGEGEIKPGTVLSETDKITLPEGSQLVIITASGMKIEVKGPFTGSVAERIGVGASAAGAGSKVNLVSAFSKLFNSSAFSTKAMGAFRSLGQPALADAWAFDVTEGGTVCFQNSADLKMWRSKPENDDVVSVKGGDVSVQFEMPKDKALVDWPTDVPTKDSSAYDVRVENGKTVLVTLKAVPADLPTRMHTAAWMSENGCERQATLLIVNADIDKLLQGLAQSGKF